MLFDYWLAGIVTAAILVYRHMRNDDISRNYSATAPRREYRQAASPPGTSHHLQSLNS